MENSTVKKDSASFERYLLSDKRKNRIIQAHDEQLRQGMKRKKKPIPVEVTLGMVHHADMLNWMAERND